MSEGITNEVDLPGNSSTNSCYMLWVDYTEGEAEISTCSYQAFQ